MSFSYEQTINLLNNAANELTRAARDFGDDRPDNELTARLHGVARHLGDVLKDLEAERDLIANGPQVTTASRVAGAVDDNVRLTDVRRVGEEWQTPAPPVIDTPPATVDTPPDPKPSASTPASGKTPKTDTASS